MTPQHTSAPNGPDDGDLPMSQPPWTVWLFLLFAVLVVVLGVVGFVIATP